MRKEGTVRNEKIYVSKEEHKLIKKGAFLVEEEQEKQVPAGKYVGDLVKKDLKQKGAI